MKCREGRQVTLEEVGVERRKIHPRERERRKRDIERKDGLKGGREKRRTKEMETGGGKKENEGGDGGVKEGNQDIEWNAKKEQGMKWKWREERKIQHEIEREGRKKREDGVKGWEKV